MRSKNEATLIGHVGGDPEVRDFPSGDKVARFGLATNEKFRDSNGVDQERTEWHRIVAFKGLADVVGKYVKKGDPLLVTGTIRTNEFTDGDGVKRQVKEIVLAGPRAEINMLGSRGSGEGEPVSEAAGMPAEARQDEIPV